MMGGTPAPAGAAITPEVYSLVLVDSDESTPGGRWELYVDNERVAVGPRESLTWIMRHLALGKLAVDAGITPEQVAARVAVIVGDLNTTSTNN